MSDAAAATATAVDQRPKRVFDWFPYFVALLSGVILVVFLIYPIDKTALYSFVKLDDELTFGNLTLANFLNFIEVPLYRDAFWNSITVALWTTLVSVLIALPAAYAVARVNIPFRTFPYDVLDHTSDRAALHRRLFVDHPVRQPRHGQSLLRHAFWHRYPDHLRAGGHRARAVAALLPVRLSVHPGALAAADPFI